MKLPVAPFLFACRGAACAALLSVSLAAAAQSCTFRTTGGPIAFGSLNPASAATVTASMQITVRCVPAAVSPTWTFSGAYGSAPLRMKHATLSAYIPYTLATTLLSSSGANEQWRVTGTVLGANYQNAYIGTYSDVLTATVTP